MGFEISRAKIKLAHLVLLAIVYVRQSTTYQTVNNTVSTERQYDMAKLAGDLGWPEERILIIADDQGKSGASTVGRTGFQTLVEAVREKRVGAIFCLEASRLSRRNSDFAQLIQLCEFTNTLIVDEYGVHDPNDPNDKIGLGLKGLFTEAEDRYIINRLQGAKLKRARDGKLRFFLPTGFVYNEAKKVILDPREDIQGIFNLVFERFKISGTARAIVIYFKENNLKIPSVIRGGERKGEIKWVVLTHGRVLSILHNPVYAGIYAYGRSKNFSEVIQGITLEEKKHRVRVKREDWQVFIQNAHPGYITCEQFVLNQEQLAENRNPAGADKRGTPRSGAALLQGLAKCSSCNDRRMYVLYPNSSKHPYYQCRHAAIEHGEKICQTLPGAEVDSAVAQLFLQAFELAQLEMSIATIEKVEEQNLLAEQQFEAALRRAKVEADKIKERFEFAADRKNKHVALELAADWEGKIAEVELLERQYSFRVKSSLTSLDDKRRQEIIALAQDLPEIWHAETTTNIERKRLLGLLIKSVAIKRTGSQIHINVEWKTGAQQGLEINLPRTAWNLRTDFELIDLIRTLGVDHTNQQIADHLNKNGYTTKHGDQFTKKSVGKLRYRFRYIEEIDGTATDDRSDLYSMAAAARLLGVNKKTIASWCKQGRFVFVQEEPGVPPKLKITTEKLSELKENLNSVKGRAGERFYNDMRQKVVDAYDNGVRSISDIARGFKMSHSFVSKALRRRYETGSPLFNSRATAKLDDESLEFVKELVKDKSDITINEICARVERDRGVKISCSLMSHILLRQGLGRRESKTKAKVAKNNGLNESAEAA